MLRHHPGPILADSNQLKQSRQKLKHRSSKEKKAKRAQSIDWTQQQQQQQQQHLMDSSAASAATTASTGNHTEDYYSVPRKCHRAVSSNYLDQSVENCPWNEGGTCQFAVVPQPPSTPPPSPPYKGDSTNAVSAMDSNHVDEIARADSMQDISRYYQ